MRWSMSSHMTWNATVHRQICRNCESTNSEEMLYMINFELENINSPFIIGNIHGVASPVITLHCGIEREKKNSHMPATTNNSRTGRQKKKKMLIKNGPTKLI